MCVLALAYDAHPRWHLVMAGNRDEFHERPAQPLARWDEPADIIAGRDLRSGGTWLGISDRGRFAVITNVRGYGAVAGEPVSRGVLVSDVLTGTGRYADPDPADLLDFNPFNMIAVVRERALFFSNRPDTLRTSLPPGLYGLSNAALDEPWPKVIQLKSALQQWLLEKSRPQSLLEVLRSETLPDGITPTDPTDAAQSPIFIRHPVYGTRCSTVVAIDRAGRGIIIERSYDAAGEATGDAAERFSWPPT